MPFRVKAFLFWWAILVVAILNAVFREATYKPLLEPVIGGWAHQISSVTGILLFFGLIYWFLKKNQGNYSKPDLWVIGAMWIGMTLVFETWMNMYVRKLAVAEVLATYYFWRGETWIFVLLSLIVSPQVADRLLKKG